MKGECWCLLPDNRIDNCNDHQGHKGSCDHPKDHSLDETWRIKVFKKLYEAKCFLCKQKKVEANSKSC